MEVSHLLNPSFLIYKVYKNTCYFSKIILEIIFLKTDNFSSLSSDPIIIIIIVMIATTVIITVEPKQFFFYL